MVSPALTNSVVTPPGSVAPNRPGRGPAHSTRHPAGQTMPAATSAQVVGAEIAGTVDVDDVAADLEGAIGGGFVVGGVVHRTHNSPLPQSAAASARTLSVK